MLPVDGLFRPAGRTTISQADCLFFNAWNGIFTSADQSDDFDPDPSPLS